MSALVSRKPLIKLATILRLTNGAADDDENLTQSEVARTPNSLTFAVNQPGAGSTFVISFGIGTLTSRVFATAAVSAPGATSAATGAAPIAAPTAGSGAAPSWILNLSDAVIKTDMTTAFNGGAVSESAMAQLFTDLAAELTANNATLSAAQFADLQTTVANLNVGETASSYLTYITNALINGNAANVQWTGGAASATSLGNLAVGSTATQLSELNGKWFLGTDLPSSYVNMSGATPYSVSYSAVANPVFGAGGPIMNDINQGYLGDCYLLASLAEVSNHNPSLIQSMVTSNGNNTYGIRFFVNGSAEYVTVNASLADGGTIFNSGTDIWGSLIEKAYAQIQAINVITGNSPNYGNSFSTIGNGGCVEYALEEITDASAMTDFASGGTSWNQYVFNDALYTQSSQSGLSTASVLATLVADLAAGNDVVLTSRTNATDSNGKTTLVADHAMSIYGYDSVTTNLQIRNPWGTMSGQTWNTTFEVSLATLLAAGDTITADNVTSSPPPPPQPPVVTLVATPSASNTSTATLGTAAPANGTDALSVTLTSDADFATGSTLVLNSGTLVYHPGLITAALAGTDTLTYVVTDTATGAVTSETQTVTLVGAHATVVSAGQTSSGITLLSGDTETVLSGGTASATVVSSGGAMYVSSGGNAVGTTVRAGGAEYVSSGGTTSRTTVSSGGNEYVSAGGSAISAAVYGGASENVLSGGTVISTTMSGGAEYVSSGGTASASIVSSGGSEVVASGGTTVGTIVRAGGREFVSGAASNTTVSSGGTVTVSSGGRTSATVVSSGGNEYVSSGGTAVGTTVFNGGKQYVYGTASGGVLSSGGTEYVSSGGTASGTTVSSGGSQYVYAGGKASATQVGSGGNAYVSSGGATIGAIVGAGAKILVYAGGSASGAVVTSGGAVYVSSGGKAYATVVSSGGNEYVSSGGTASGTVIAGSGQEVVYKGGIDQLSVVSSGGLEFISSGGTISGGTIISGGKLTVYSGGTVAGGLAISGGTAVISATMASGQTVTFIGAGGTLGLVNPASFAATIKSFGTGDRIDLIGFGYSSSDKLTFTEATGKTSGTLKVVSGTKSATMTLLGNYTSSNFTLVTDGVSGTFVNFH